MRRFFRKSIYLTLALLVILSVGACKKKGPNYDVGRKAPTETHKIQKKKVANLYLIREMNMNEEMITLQSLKVPEQIVRYPYSLTTKFKNRFGEIASWNSFYPGRVVKIGERQANKALSSVTLADEVWEKEDVKNFTLQVEDGVLKLGNTNYKMDDSTPVFSNNEVASYMQIGDGDVLRVVGKGKEVISVSITTGHGSIKLLNTSLFKDSMVGIGTTIFTNISEEGMEIDVPEGKYPLTVANNGYGGTKEVEVKRGETTVVDLNELKGEGPKSCEIKFHVAVEGAKIYLDDAEMQADTAVSVKYGKHKLTVMAEGYNTWTKTLYVNSPTAEITLDLSDEAQGKENSGGNTDKKDSNKSSESNSSGSNSSNSSNSSSGKSNNSGFNYGGSSNKDSNNVRSITDKDYLQTMQDALSSLLKTD